MRSTFADADFALDWLTCTCCVLVRDERSIACAWASLLCASVSCWAARAAARAASTVAVMAFAFATA